MKSSVLLGVAGAALLMGSISPAYAQAVAEGDAEVTNSEDIVVLGRIEYRNRVEGAAPVLQYEAEYFQRFEPLTVGDALKRVPSVAFLSDVLESDGVRLRGLDPAYTQILINGEQVPGSGDSSGAFGNGADGAFFVDRIPAELIDRIEVVRSHSANRSGDAVAGAINIILRDSYSLDGGYVRGGVQYWANDEELGSTLGAVWGGEVGGGRLLIGANMQDRHNPKDKLSLRYDEPGGTLENSEIQTDVRDGTDYSGNFSYEIDALGGELAFNGFIVQTDRTQTEGSVEYTDGVVADANLETVNANDVDIDQRSWSLGARYSVPLFGGEARVRVGYAAFENNVFEFEDELAYDPYPAIDEYESEVFDTELTDREWRIRLDQRFELSSGAELQFGVDYENKERENLVLSNDFGASPGDPDFPVTPPFNGSLVDLGGLSAVDGGDNTIERTRLDPYVMLSGETASFDWEVGLRYETTELTVEDRTTGTTVDSENEVLLPSAHIAWNLTDNDRVLLSAARTVRNPSFTFLSPATLEEELGDSDFEGDPTLEPEISWGFDVGYERRLGRTGVFGINYFYREVSDLIEVFNTGAEGSEGPGTFIYSARNTGDGTVWGVEVDLSTSLGAFGLENTGVFFNYSWLDSDVEDDFGSRRFNSQAESIINVGFIQDLPSLNSSFGLTYRDQGSAFSRVVSEETTTEYGADLEFFVEHRFTESFTLRLTGSNLLDESKDEIFDKFDNAADQVARDYDEFEVESESAGPVFQLVGRYAF